VRVAFRTDASLEIGTGHVVRCLALADTLVRRGAEVTFICRRAKGDLCDQIEQAGHGVGRLPDRDGWFHDAEDSLDALRMLGLRPDLLVVDQYALERGWEHALRSVTGRILVIDDLANRMHDCDILLDPNLHDSPETRYRGLVGESTQVFVGPQYALLRPEFDLVAPRTRDRGVNKILAFFGGSDPSNEAQKIICALRALATRAPRTVLVLGPIHPHAQEIRQAALGLSQLDVVGPTREMARFMGEADLALGTCGGAAWERCLLGLPALVVVSADNQRDDARILHSLGAVRSLGDAYRTSVETWVSAIADMQECPKVLMAMSRAAQSVMQGRREALREFEGALVH
jgi:UDP-2,4-diacetamido-2,4,6-trideoxy-beta-L-altropyranose hydrolase